MPLPPLLDRFLTNLALDWRFVTSRAAATPPGERLAYLPRKYAAIIANRRSIDFLGRPFVYDNRLMPALLQGYPDEIATLDQWVGFAHARSVIDVGANVGQFGFALKSFFPHIAVYSFEPNPEPYAMLADNATRFSGWATFPFGLAQTAGTREFFFVKGKSAQGSVFAENATMNLIDASRQAIDVRLEHLTDAALEAYGIPAEIDLVKVDVEGAEFDVLESLDRIRWRYLYLELSLGRAGTRSLESVLSLLERQHGRRPRVVYQHVREPATALADVILASG